MAHRSQSAGNGSASVSAESHDPALSAAVDFPAQDAAAHVNRARLGVRAALAVAEDLEQRLADDEGFDRLQAVMLVLAEAVKALESAQPLVDEWRRQSAPAAAEAFKRALQAQRGPQQ